MPISCPRRRTDQGRCLALFGMDRTRARRNSRLLRTALWPSILLIFIAVIGYPGSARADSSGTQYENAVPTATGKSPPPRTQGVAVLPISGHRSRTPSAAVKRRAHVRARARRKHIRRQVAGSNRPQTPKSALRQGGEISPLVPALIAIGAVAALAAGVLIFRRRRERGRSPAAAQNRLPRSS